MADQTKIEWCHHTWNAWTGCQKVDAGCLNCYAEADFDHRKGVSRWGAHGTRTMKMHWNDPFRWNTEARAAGERRRVFVNSMSDFGEGWQGPIQDFHKVVRPGISMSDLRSRCFETFARCRSLNFLLLTKRPENFLSFWPRDCDGSPKYLANVWIGTSVSDRRSLDKRLPLLMLLRSLTPVLFLSCEPLLESVTLPKSLSADWVIVGGESGRNARVCNQKWIESLRDQCREMSVPVFVKQMGGNSEVDDVDGRSSRVPFVHRKGGDPAEWPEALRVRQFPLGVCAS